MFKINPLDIKVDNSWMGSGMSNLPVKTSSCILMKQDGSVQSIGYKAQEEYTELLLNGEADSYLFFEKFKSLLYYDEVKYLQ